MDNMKIIKRAWYILWNYRALWIFGLILAMTIGSSSFRPSSTRSFQNNRQNNNPSSYTLPWDAQTFQDPQKFMETMQEVGKKVVNEVVSRHDLGVLIGFAVLFFLFVVLVAIGMTILRYVAESALMQMVDGFEARGEKLTFRQGFRSGWSITAWRLFLIDLLIGFVPSLVFILLLGASAWGAYSLVVRMADNSGGVLLLAVLAGLIFLLMLFFGIFFIILGLLRNFMVRACALEQVGVWESIKRGFSLVRSKWQPVGLFWLVMIGLGIAWWIVSTILLIVFIPFFLVTVILGLFLGSLPGLILGLLSSAFISGYWPIVIGVAFGLPLFILVAASPLFVIQAFAHVFRSTSWTLAFRELRSMEASAAVVEVPAP